MKSPTIVLFLINILNANSNNISNSKCREYGKLVYVEKASPVLLKSSEKIVDSECGMVSVPLIVGGTKAGEKEFPHMAILGFANGNETNLQWLCGGALISDQFVLTAAHCIVNSFSKLPIKIRFGVLDLKNLDDSMQERGIEKIIVHPDYKPPPKYNDIALIKLDDPVEFTAFVRPACLGFSKTIENHKAIATGFGKTAYNSDEGSDFLMKVTLNLYSNAMCQKYFITQKNIYLGDGIVDSMLCAGQLEGGKDTCNGDSGGPLQIELEEPYCMYSVIGVTSFGKYCGLAQSPAIYTRVDPYLSWIESIVWGNNP